MWRRVGATRSARTSCTPTTRSRTCVRAMNRAIPTVCSTATWMNSWTRIYGGACRAGTWPEKVVSPSASPASQPVVVDYGAGNLRSVARALTVVGYEPRVTNDPSEVLGAHILITPGVGAAGQIMSSLRGLELDDAIRRVIDEGRPF